eukprot:863272-Rhodomonas_salina.1
MVLPAPTSFPVYNWTVPSASVYATRSDLAISSDSTHIVFAMGDQSNVTRRMVSLSTNLEKNWDIETTGLVIGRPEIWRSAASPASQIVTFSTADGYLISLSLNDASEKWRYRTPAAVPPTVFTTSASVLPRFSPFPLISPSISPPSPRFDSVFPTAPAGQSLLRVAPPLLFCACFLGCQVLTKAILPPGDSVGNLHCVDAETGGIATLRKEMQASTYRAQRTRLHVFTFGMGAMYGSDVAFADTTCLAMSGADVGCAATRRADMDVQRLCSLRLSGSSPTLPPTRTLYPDRGTDTGYLYATSNNATKSYACSAPSLAAPTTAYTMPMRSPVVRYACCYQMALTADRSTVLAGNNDGSFLPPPLPPLLSFSLPLSLPPSLPPSIHPVCSSLPAFFPS